MPDAVYDPSRHLKAGRGKVYGSILDTIGDTPIVGLPRLSAEYSPKATVLAKLEFFNPIASVKDRIGVAMIDALEQAGKIRPGAVLIEPGEAYFLHSFAFEGEHVLATTEHGAEVTAAIGRDNLAGVQFHPEKSQRYGIALLERFLAWRP